MIHSPNRVLLVTDELFPFSAGGIGRILHNLILDSLTRTNDVEFHVMAPAESAIQPDRVQEYFDNRVTLHHVAFRQGYSPTADSDGEIYPPAAAFTDCICHAQSLDILLAIKRLTKEGLVFDTIEFPDYRGWAFCTLQEKHLSRDLLSTEITVRLHSCDGLLQHFEARPVTFEQLGLFELERKSLHDADRIITHLPAIAKFNAEYYGFNSSWCRKVVVQFPPVMLNSIHENVPSAASTASDSRDLLFITKLQPCKGPDLFIRGAAHFMRSCPEFKGRAITACHAFDPGYESRIRSLVPADLAQRFVFLTSGISQAEREALVRNNIVVIPSLYESLCLAAYEVSAKNTLLILNDRCPAFAEGSPFQHGINCHKFDGSVEGLANTLLSTWRNPSNEAVSWTADIPYWEMRSDSLSPTAHTRTNPRPRVSVVITNYNLGCYLPEAIASVSASTYEDLEIIVVDDSSTAELDHTILERIEIAAADGKGSIKLVRNPVNRGLAGSRNIGIKAATGKYILPLDADDCISPRFLELAVQALESQPEFDLVVPTAAYFRSDAELVMRTFSDYAVFLGDVPSFGLVANRFSCATSLMRRSLFERFSYNEKLKCYEDWDLYLRLCCAGYRFLVTNDIHFYYRDRGNSMVKDATTNPEYHLQSLARLLEDLPSPIPRSVRLFGLLSPAMYWATSGNNHHAVVDLSMEKIKASVSWRLVNKWWTFKEQLLPTGSVRRRVWEYPVRKLRGRTIG